MTHLLGWLKLKKNEVSWSQTGSGGKEISMDFDKKCCFCGCEVKGIGNNPKPVEMRSGATCCDWCNSSIVMVARIRALLKLENENKE